MLEAGEIDALISAIVPQASLNAPARRRLFPHAEAAEHDYFPPHRHLPDHAHRRLDP